jgi:hypothetical protein
MKNCWLCDYKLGSNSGKYRNHEEITHQRLDTLVKKGNIYEARIRLIILVSLVALLIVTSGCAAAGAQTREPYTYSSEIYDTSKFSPATEQEVLDFLARDSTDENLWIAGRYECGHFAADVWWNSYMQGLEACMVWVNRMKWGEEQLHWVVKFRIEDGIQNYWLWVEPSSDKVVDEDNYAIQDAFCGEEAFNLCKTWWEEKS